MKMYDYVSVGTIRDLGRESWDIFREHLKEMGYNIDPRWGQFQDIGEWDYAYLDDDTDLVFIDQEEMAKIHKRESSTKLYKSSILGMISERSTPDILGIVSSIKSLELEIEDLQNKIHVKVNSKTTLLQKLKQYGLTTI